MPHAESPDWDAWPALLAQTDGMGRLLAANAELRALAAWPSPLPEGLNLDQLLPPASRILMQTHVWPMLHAQNQVRELHLILRPAGGAAVPVLLNAKRSAQADGSSTVQWLFLVTHERTRFESALLEARQRAQAEAQARAEREGFLQTLANALPSLVSYWDRDLRCRYANQAQQQAMRPGSADLLGMRMEDAVGPQRYAQKEARARAALAGQAQQFELQSVDAQGRRQHWQHDYVPDRRSDGSVQGFFVLGTDITALKESALALELAALVFERTPQGIAVTDENGSILSVNRAFTAITGYSAEEAVGRNPRLLNSGTHDSRFFADFWQQLQAKGQWSGEIWNRRKNGELFIALQTVNAVRDADHAAQRYVTVFTDVTERWRDNERMRHLALHDALTGLANRQMLETMLTQLLSQMQRADRRLAVLFLDLDGFKTVNDQLGHQVGDALLKAVARRLTALVRSCDCVARLGGDEFVIALDNPSSGDEVAQVGERIVAALAEPFVLGQREGVHIGVSVGVAQYGPGCQSVAELLRQADEAMYAAKAAGKGRVRFSAQA